MTDDLIARAKAALMDVTPGPWNLEDGTQHRPIEVSGCLLAHFSRDPSGPKHREANARFIADARQLVPDLIAALEARDARIAELEKDKAFIISERDATFRVMLARAEAAEARVKVLEDALRRIFATSSAMSADYIYGGGEGGHERTARLARAALEGEK